MSRVVKIRLGIFVGFILLIGAGVALIAVGKSDEPPEGGGRDTGIDDPAVEDTGGSQKRSPQRTLRFSGNGSKNIGTVKVTDDAVLKWTHSESRDRVFFTITDDDSKVSVSSDAKSGLKDLDPGTYKDVDVSGTGDWTITIEDP